MNVPGDHLSEDQMDELLMEIADPSVEIHSAQCEHCAARLIEFRSSIAQFNQASLAWSEARSNTLTRDLRAHRLSPVLSRTTLWSCLSAGAVAAALLCTVGVEHRATSRNSGLSAASGADYASSRQQEIASDNAMLQAISSEIDRPVLAPSVLREGDPGAQTRSGEQERNWQ